MTDILQFLKEKRAQIARREGKELFKVFHNATLEATAAARPQTKSDLVGIKGWGGKKIEMYGDEIIAAINETKQGESADGGILSVEALVSSLNTLFASVGIIKVRGDIVEAHPHPNGYCFFILKDPQTQDHSVSCYINKWKFEGFSHVIETGMEVIVTARPSLYKNGRFSLIVEAVEPYGEGALKKAFEALKQKLEAKGYFDSARKRPIPEHIQKIGLVTSESGAAIRDFRKNLGEYGLQIFFLDVRVEGDMAERSIISAITWFNKNSLDLDTLVLIRGGGGLEELRAFNSERVAEAIALSRLPILTGIGHERDQTIADFTADRAFSTPSMVAAFIKQQREGLIDRVRLYAQNLTGAANEILNEKKEYVERECKELQAALPPVITQYAFRLSKIAEQMHNGLNGIFRGFRIIERAFSQLMHEYEIALHARAQRIAIARHQCIDAWTRARDATNSRLKTVETALASLNPEAILSRGYSIAYGASRRVLKNAGDAKRGEHIFLKLHKGALSSRVERIEN